MSGATVWFVIGIAGFSLAGLFLVIAVFMFIKMRIPAVIGDLTGKTVAREIKAMRETNATGNNKLHKPSRVNADRGMLTNKQSMADGNSAAADAHLSKRLQNPSASQDNFSQETEPLKTEKTGAQNITERISSGVTEVEIGNDKTTLLTEEDNTDILLSGEATEILESNATEVLESNATEVLESNATEILESNATEILESNATEVLSDYHEAPAGAETTVLNNVQAEDGEVKTVAFKVVRDLTEIHTDEVINT